MRNFTILLVIILLIIAFSFSSCIAFKRFMNPQGRSFTDSICNEYTARCEMLKSKFAIRPIRSDTNVTDALGNYVDSLQWYLIDKNVNGINEKKLIPLLIPVYLLMEGDFNKQLYFYYDEINISSIIPMLGEVKIITTGPCEIKRCGEDAVSIPPIRRD